MGRDEIESEIAEHLHDRAPAVVAAWLYGSVARGDDQPTSDVDVAVLLQRSERPTKLADLPLDLEAELASLLGREVQLVVADHAPDDLVHRILVDGRLLLDRNPSARIAFEVASRSRFFDMQPIWNAYRKRAS